MKQAKENPWEAFEGSHHKGDNINVIIKSITDFGVFIGLEGGIDGLVHTSDITWNEGGEEAIRNYKKGDEVETVILAVDAERERISLGIKQLDKDPYADFVAANPKGAIVKGVIGEVDAKGAVIDLGNGVEGYLRASELSRDRVEDARTVLTSGDEVEAKFTGIDRKSRNISLSIKAKDTAEENATISDYKSGAAPAGGTLGDLLKQQMDGGDE